MYIIGIDVGGTNTDATLLYRNKVMAMAKVPTDHSNLFQSTKSALEQVLRFYQGTEPVKLHLSTTLSTNTIVEGTGTPTEMAVIPGPGVNLATYQFPFKLHELKGYVDHRGREVAPLDIDEIKQLHTKLPPDCAIGIAGKFSHRNPSQEQHLQKLLGARKETISLGHRLSGKANFPRRIVTTYLNASVAKSQAKFSAMWEQLLQELSVPIEEILILKADGGTMTFKDSGERPIETILSGPAASIMGAKALSKCTEKNFLIIDIGGTTTDLAAVVEGEVLFERSGATILGYQTLVPALLTRSVGLGGDSELHYRTQEQKLQVGPKRAGSPVCLGGSKLTPTDAAVALGLADLGDKNKAVAAWQNWAQELDKQWEDLARLTLTAFTSQLEQAVEALYQELENVPLYTISEVLHPPQVRPNALVALGAPAEVFVPFLAEKLALPYEILPFSAGANAVGAAAAQATIGLTLHADTELATITIPEMGLKEELENPLFFTLEKAREMAAAKTKEHARNHGYGHADEIYVVEEEQFNMVRGFRTVGKTITVRTQLRPGISKVEGG